MSSPPSGLAVLQGTLPWCASLLLVRMLLSAVRASHEPLLCVSLQSCWYFTVAPIWELLLLMLPQLMPTLVPGREGPCPCAVLTVLDVVSVLFVSCHCCHLHVPCSALVLGLVAQAGPSCGCTVPALCK